MAATRNVTSLLQATGLTLTGRMARSHAKSFAASNHMAFFQWTLEFSSGSSCFSVSFRSWRETQFFRGVSLSIVAPETVKRHRDAWVVGETMGHDFARNRKKVLRDFTVQLAVPRYRKHWITSGIAAPVERAVLDVREGFLSAYWDSGLRESGYRHSGYWDDTAALQQSAYPLRTFLYPVNYVEVRSPSRTFQRRSKQQWTATAVAGHHHIRHDCCPMAGEWTMWM